MPLPLGRRVTAARLFFRFAALVAVFATAPAQAQAPLTLVDDETSVGSVGFAFSEGQTLEVANLELQIATTAPPGKILGVFGGGDRDATYPFLPVELAKDVVRLTRYYEQSGFPRASVDYAVVLDTTRNRAAVTFEIAEGPPLLVREVTFAGPGQSPVADVLAPELRNEWREFARRPVVATGDRLDAFALVQLQSRTLAWLRNRGYAWADAGAEQFPDSTGLRADVRVKVNVGPRARVSAVQVEGDSSLARGVITRELPVQPGDLFDASALVDGQREVFGLGLFTLALVDIAPEAVRGDTLVPVVVRVRRGPSRILNAFTGYFSDGGVTVQASATHLNAFGGARRLGAALEWRTGIGAGLGGGGRASVTGGPIRDFRLSLPFRQPYVFDRRLSYTLQPSYRVRDDEIESSTQTELSNTLLYTRGPLQTAGLSLTGRARDLSRGLGLRILDAGQFAEPPGPFLPDTLQATTGVVGLDVVWGKLDDALQPTRGYVLRPSASIAGGDVAYGRARLAASVTIPLQRRVGVVARLTVGTLAAFGRTSPDNLADYVLFRDQLFYAGGTGDVRGWAAARLGPKTFAVTPPVVTAGETPSPSLITSPGDVNYVGVGGRYKASGSLQLNLPLPLGPQWGANVFADAGLVAAPSDVPAEDLVRAAGTRADADLADVLAEEGGLRVGVGAGIQYLTPVGFVSIGLGFKVNPSALDIREPAAVYCGSSIFAGEPSCGADALGDETYPGYVGARQRGAAFDIDDVPTRKVLGLGVLGRLQPHFSIGQTF